MEETKGVCSYPEGTGAPDGSRKDSGLQNCGTDLAARRNAYSNHGMTRCPIPPLGPLTQASLSLMNPRAIRLALTPVSSWCMLDASEKQVPIVR